jgi:plastocyanin
MTPIRTASALLLLAAAIAGCGGGEGREAAPAAAPDTPAGTPPPLLAQPEPAQELSEEITTPSDGVIVVTIGAGAFNENHLEIPLGEPVTIRVINGDDTVHDLRIAGFDGQWMTQDDAVTQPEAIRGGESGEVVFSPLLPGAYTFRCDFHAASMGGRITVE